MKLSAKKFMVFLLAIVFVLSFVGSAFAEESASGQTWDVSVGKETGATSLDSMFPNVIYIHEGDTVKFTNGAQVNPHTVTFLAGAAPLSPFDPNSAVPSASSGVQWNGKALLNSGQLDPGKSYSITFTASGAYPYACVFHPLMSGTVVVMPKGHPIPSLAEQKASAKALLDDLLAQADALTQAKKDAIHVRNDDGTFTYKLSVGVGQHGFITNQMLPETVFISEGDSVEWLNDNHYEPHFVTFNKSPDMTFFTSEGVNPIFLAPAGGNKFDGSDFTNSGLMMPQQSYKLTFTKAGSYKYEDTFHSGSKMTGTVVVAPKNTVKVLVNGKPLLYKGSQPHLHNNRVYAAINPVAEALGGKVERNGKLNAIVIQIGGKFKLPAKLKKVQGVAVVINGKQLLGNDSELHVHDGQSYVSLQEMVSLLGGSYSWDEATKTFSLTVQSGAAADTGTNSNAHVH